MKKSTLAILTTVITFAPLTAFAQTQDTQPIIQTNSNSAAVVGNGNFIHQNATQASQQHNVNLDAYGIPATPNAQTAVQDNVNSAAAVGHGNVIGQDATQTNVQGQVDINQYLPSGYNY